MKGFKSMIFNHPRILDLPKNKKEKNFRLSDNYSMMITKSNKTFKPNQKGHKRNNMKLLKRQIYFKHQNKLIK